ncbi:hypothetical protein CON45_29290 [Priestia megaterium]|uniref:hypothetical protein n=1 Tax=Priestia megaterium TaxID=1404 RepID=UPI000BEC44FC|nr:hypothetical protein [Priestia megaterium]PEA35576.1 hypothetical protein CON45_29290 [Priestia megaterium]
MGKLCLVCGKDYSISNSFECTPGMFQVTVNSKIDILREIASNYSLMVDEEKRICSDCLQKLAMKPPYNEMYPAIKDKVEENLSRWHKCRIRTVTGNSQ